MIWHPYQASGKDNYIFTHANYYIYIWPPGFNFNDRDDSINDNKDSYEYNVDKKAKEFSDYFKSMA
jgi:hypothetical protein